MVSLVTVFNGRKIMNDIIVAITVNFVITYVSRYQYSDKEVQIWVSVTINNGSVIPI